MRVGDRFNPFRLFRGVLIPEAICRYEDLSPGAKLCYGRLVRYAGENGECYPSVRTLAAEIAVKLRQARNYLAQLTREGFIRRVSLEGKSNRFEFLWHQVFEEEPRQDPAAPPRQESAAHPGKIVPPKRVNKRDTPRAPDWGAPFDEWWGIYPRKVAKADGRRAFEQVIVLGKAKNGLDQDLRSFADFDGRRSQLMKATRGWADYEFSQRSADKVPYPATFINRGDWLAAPEPRQQTPDGFRRSWE